MIVTSACPSCGAKNTRETYDIGDGDELCCVMCEWCWGADGQPLTMGPIDVMQAEIEAAGLWPPKATLREET